MMFSLLHPYYDHRFMLNYQLEEWNNWSKTNKENIQIILIDDHSKVHPFDPKYHEINCNIDVYRILDDIPWNVSGVKNLGFKLAETDWIIAVDMDLILEGKEINKIKNLDFSDKYKIYFPQRRRITGRHEVERRESPHCNSFIMNKKTFWEAGGYDEDFAGGWGYEDSHFHKVSLTKLPVEVIVLDNIFFSSRHASKGRTPTVKTRHNHGRNEKLYQNKRDGKLPQHSGKILNFKWEKVYSHRVS